jgi:hypothetical protein
MSVWGWNRLECLYHEMKKEIFLMGITEHKMTGLKYL